MRSKRAAKRKAERLMPGHLRMVISPSYAPVDWSERVVPLVASLLSIVIAAVIHVALFFTATELTGPASDAVKESNDGKLQMIAVDLTPPPEPPPPPPPPPEEIKPEPIVEETIELPAEPAPEPEPAAAPEPPPPPQNDPPKPKAKPQAEEPAKVEPQNTSNDDPWADAADFGAFEGSTSGAGSIAVSTGSSAAGTLSSGGRQREARPEPKPEPVVAEPGPAEPVEKKPKVVSRKKLSQEARPNESFNRKVKASYPPAMKAAGIEADVVAVVTIGPDGKVLDVRVVNKVDESFAEAAIEAFKKFRFEPALENGKAVASELRLRYRFRLDEA